LDSNFSALNRSFQQQLNLAAFSDIIGEGRDKKQAFGSFSVKSACVSGPDLPLLTRKQGKLGFPDWLRMMSKAFCLLFGFGKSKREGSVVSHFYFFLYKISSLSNRK
jgi:hypothetical protein